MLTLYYGYSKGKTCAAIGCAVRAAAKDKKVLFVDFIHQSEMSDRKALETMYAITVSGTPVDLELTADTAADSKAQASKVFRELFDSAVRTVLTQKYDMLILDGVFDAVDKGFLPDAEVHDFLSNAPNSLEIICTGANIDDKFLSLATYATKFDDQKTTE